MMFARSVLGLDIGSYALKAAELRAGLRGVEFTRFEMTRLPTDPSEREETLRIFIQDRALPLEFVVAALPADRCTQRHLRFPFDDPKKIARALPFEVEEELPVPLTDLVLTHEPGLVRPEQTEVLAILAQKSTVAAQLAELRSAGMEPRILEMEGAVLANLARFLELDDQSRLFLDVGHRKTTLCLLVEGRPALLRSIPVAGRQLTVALAEKLGLGPEAAEQQKHELGVFEADSTTPVCSAVAEQLDRLVREVARTVQSSAVQRLAPVEIVLVGGSAALPRLDAFFEEKTQLPCRPLRVEPGDGGRSLLTASGPEAFAHAAALALRGALRGRTSQLDFRQGELRYVPDLTQLRRGLRPTVALLLLTIVLWVGQLFVGLQKLEGQANTLRADLSTVYASAFPNEPETNDPLRAIEMRVRETRELANHLGVTGNNLSPLEILREISERIPIELDVGLTELQIERYSVQARGYAPSFEAVDQIRAELSKVEDFENVRLSDVVSDQKRGGKNFSLSIRLEDGT
jgi:type IV pilus assembly protein PilM